MKSRDILSQKWHELRQFWEDDASRSFENQHLNKITECIKEIEHEYEKFKRCANDCQ